MAKIIILHYYIKWRKELIKEWREKARWLEVV